MKKLSLLVLLLGMFAGAIEARQATAPSATASSLIEDFLTAYNNQDASYFERMFAADAVVLDEDGHTLSGKDRLLRILGGRLSATPSPRLTATDITGSNTDTVAWGSLNYTFEQAGQTRMGFMTLVFRQSGANWEIAHWQFSYHAPGEG